MPLLNWEKCLDGKFYFMRLKRAKEYDESDVIAFYELYNKYLEAYGLTDEHQRYVDAQKVYIELCADYLESGDEFTLNYIAIAEADMNKLKPTNEKDGMTIGQVVTILNKWQGGGWISKKDISVEEYKDLIKEYERSSKEK